MTRTSSTSAQSSEPARIELYALRGLRGSGGSPPAPKDEASDAERLLWPLYPEYPYNWFLVLHKIDTDEALYFDAFGGPYSNAATATASARVLPPLDGSDNWYLCTISASSVPTLVREIRQFNSGRVNTTDWMDKLVQELESKRRIPPGQVLRIRTWRIAILPDDSYPWGHDKGRNRWPRA